MTVATPPPTLMAHLRTWRPGPAVQLLAGLGVALGIALAVVGPDRLLAQIEGDRGIAPIASTTDIQIGGIQVSTTGKNAEEARQAGWKLAQRLAWQKLKGPEMSDGDIDAMVAAVVIEQEQIGPRRYIAKLGVIFDRAKAGAYLAGAAAPGAEGEAGAVLRSAPLLIVPVLYSGGVSQVFEVRGPWQRAWANFKTGASPIDYVRPSGAGSDSLILTAGQPGRRSRIWWRHVLDQFGAADVIIPVARLERQWPGGPVRGIFTARFGPDNTYLDSFTLTAKDEDGVPAMLDQALVRFDRIYADALIRGVLKPDPTLVEDQRSIDLLLAKLNATLQQEEAGAALASSAEGPAQSQAAAQAQQAASTFVIQFSSPDARAVDTALSAVRGLPGVQAAATSSIAIGGTSVMRVTSAGDIESLAAALRTRGWQVSVGSNVLSIRR